jgi:hypothetical protein
VADCRENVSRRYARAGLPAEAVQAPHCYVAGRYATDREAVEAGYVDVNFVDTHDQLHTLRWRADFQALMREMRAQGPAKLR